MKTSPESIALALYSAQLKMGALIKQASTETERQRIYRFRYNIYIEEMGKPMPDADHERRMLHDEYDPRSIHLYAERDGEIAGALRLIWGRDGLPPVFVDWYGLEMFREFSPTEISFTGRLMAAKQYRSSLLGVSLAQEIYRIARESGLAFDFIHTTQPLVGYFERLGYRRYKSDFLDPDLGPRTPMILVLQDIAHLETCQSPFLRTAHQLTNSPESADWFKERFSEKSLC